MSTIKGLVNLPHGGMYATTEAVLHELFRTIGDMGYVAKPRQTDGHDPLHPEWVIEPGEGSSGRRSKYVHEAWHWAPLEPDPKLHEIMLTSIGMPYDCGMYLQDDTPGFHEIHLTRLRLFVAGLTKLDIAAWDAMVARTPKSGPEFIRGMAAFCHPDAVVTDVPNEGNLFVALGRALSGRKPSRREMEAAGNAWRRRDRGPALRKLVDDR